MRREPRVYLAHTDNYGVLNVETFSRPFNADEWR